MSTTGEPELYCANCGKTLPQWSVDDNYCGESCQADWLRKHWRLPTFTEEVRNGYQRFYR